MCENDKACSCPIDRKVPACEKTFLEDQRTVRKMAIGNLDIIATKRNLARSNRSEIRSKLRASSQACSTSSLHSQRLNRPTTSLDRSAISTSSSKRVNFTYDDAPSSSSTNSSADNSEQMQLDQMVERPSPQRELESVSPAPETQPKPEPLFKANQMRLNLREVPKIADRFGISDRAAAALATAVLVDFNLVTAEDASLVIDRSKIRRAREKLRKESANKLEHLHGEVNAFYFDGRKDETIKIVAGRRKKVVEDHISLIQEPGSYYLGHCTIDTGHAKAIVDSIKNVFTEKNVSLDNLKAIGSDGTNVNVGHSGGAIRLFELELNRPVQWLICLLHCAELPLRHLFIHLDGVTSGPRCYTGPIGKQLAKCDEVPVVATFKNIQFDVDIQDVANFARSLNSDQSYLYDMCLAISIGYCSDDLVKRPPGKLNHSRWLTLANRILRLYVASQKPSKNLQTLAEFIIKVYAPMVFQIKNKPSCTMGSRHLADLIISSRYLPEHLLAVINPVIERNGFYAHPENILLAMLDDDRKHIRELGWKRILGAAQTNEPVRKFVIPAIAFDCTEYVEMISWTDETVTLPPLLSLDEINMANIDLLAATKISDSNLQLNFRKMPCHSQAVERCVRLVTEASKAVCGIERRNGWIVNTLRSRNDMPTFEIKSDFRISCDNIFDKVTV